MAMPVHGLRSHPLQEIHRMDFVTASRAGDCFTAFPTNQRWVRNDDKNRGGIGRLAGCEAASLSCVIEWTLFSFHEQGIASHSAQGYPLGSR